MDSFNCAMSKLLLDENEDDVIKIQFPNEEKRIKCSISILSEVSPIFKAMFSGRWCQNANASLETINGAEFNDTEKIMKIIDLVDFDQYLTFKSFMEILYGLRQIDSIDQAMAVYYYAHKYHVADVEKKILKFLCERMGSECQFEVSADDIQEVIKFVHVYQPDELIKMLDQITPALNEENALKYFELATQYEMTALKKEVVSYMAKVPPSENWTTEVYRSVIIHLKGVVEQIKIMLSDSDNTVDEDW